MITKCMIVFMSLSLRKIPKLASSFTFHSKNQGLYPKNVNNILSNNIFISRKISINSSISNMNNNRINKKSIEEQMQLVKDMMHRISQCNECPPSMILYDFIVDNEKIGKVTKQMSQLLSSTGSPPVFQLLQTPSDTNNSQKPILTLTSHAGTTYESRTESIGIVMKTLQSQNIIQGWRDELYPACFSFYASPKFLIERAAAPFLGIQQYGVHVNGLVRDDSSNEIKMWIGRRSADKSKYPGMLDHLVAGGQPHGISVLENVVKECHEEAGIPEEIAKNSQPVGCVNYQTLETVSIPGQEDDLHVVSRSVLFCYDLLLPSNFTPTVVDGEVQDFFTWDLEEVAASMDTKYHDPIKPNCYLVIIDFLVRMGYLTPDVEGYLDVLRGLRNDECA